MKIFFPSNFQDVTRGEESIVYLEEWNEGRVRLRFIEGVESLRERLRINRTILDNRSQIKHFRLWLTAILYQELLDARSNHG